MATELAKPQYLQWPVGELIYHIFGNHVQTSTQQLANKAFIH